MDSGQFVIFMVNGEEFGLNIENVSGIERMLDIVRVPNSPDYIEGLANLRGKVVTIFNLRKRFNLPCPGFDENTKIIIAGASGSDIGIIVDEVRQIARIEGNDIEPAPKAFSRLRDKFLLGTGKIGDRMILLVDPEKILLEEVHEEDLKIAKKRK